MTVRSTAPFGIYIHWPFCTSKCPYCDFNSHVAEQINSERWRQAYLAEIERYRAETRHRVVTSVFFGGGTPSLMEPDIIGEIIKSIKNSWTVDEHLEITIEANPSSAEIKKFEAYQSLGVNRISIGVQSLNDEALSFLGREHSAAEAINAVKNAATIFEQFSFDLIYGLPGQTIKSWQKELNYALELCEKHISVYQLTIEPGTFFYRQGIKEADETTGKELYDCTQKILGLAGLPAYEISNHAKPGFECSHNLLYWRGEDYLGIGPGAHGRLKKEVAGKLLGTEAIEEIKSPDKWLDAVQSKGGGTKKRNLLQFEERLEELILCGLRTSEGLDPERFYRITGRGLFNHLHEEKLDRLIDAGFVVDSRSNLRLTENGLRCLNSVVKALLI